MFYNQYTFSSFLKSEPLNLSDFMMKLKEELRILFFYKEVNPLIKLSKKLGIFLSTESHLRRLHKCLRNDGIAERNGKGIQSPNSTSKKSLHNFGFCLNLCLNLCSLRWLNPSLNLVRNFKPMGLWMLQVGLAVDQPIFGNKI